MKKFELKKIIAFLILFFFFSLSGMAYSQSFKVGKFTYTIISETDKTVELTDGGRKVSGESYENHMTIPECVEANGNVYTVISIGKEALCYSNPQEVRMPDTITKIDEKAFYKCQTLRKIYFSGRLLSIEKEAFRGCSNLEDLEFPESLMSIEYYAFSGCSKLTKLFLPSSLTNIGEGAFAYCSKISEIRFPESLSTIKDLTFARCNSLKNIILPTSLKYLLNKAFTQCINLESIYIPENVESIDRNIFEGCLKLKEINVSEANENYTVWKGILYDKNLTELIIAPLTVVTVEIPETVTVIPESAFNHCEALTSVTLPGSVTRIEDRAFADCKNLRQINLPNPLTYIGKSAFFWCESLEEVIMQDNVEEIGRDIYHGCLNLKSVRLSEKIKKIPLMAFSYCYALKEIKIPNMVEVIESSAFFQCESLSKVYLPNGVNLGSSVFSYCQSLSEFILEDDNPLYSTENGILYNKEKNKMLLYPSAKGNVVIPDFVTEIGDECFAWCVHLTSITFGPDIKTIGMAAFFNNKKLQTITCPAITPPETQSAAFATESISYIKCNAYVPKESLEAYKEAWYYFDIYPMPGTSDVEEISVAVSEGPYTVYSIDGRRVMHTENREELNSLPADLYIINGKKMLIGR